MAGRKSQTVWVRMLLAGKKKTKTIYFWLAVKRSKERGGVLKCRPPDRGEKIKLKKGVTWGGRLITLPGGYGPKNGRNAVNPAMLKLASGHHEMCSRWQPSVFTLASRRRLNANAAFASARPKRNQTTPQTHKRNPNARTKHKRNG